MVYGLRLRDYIEGNYAMATTHFTGLNLKETTLVESAAGTHTVTGITTDDTIVSVSGFKLALDDSATPVITFTALDLLSEFSISAANTVTNASGTSLADSVVTVVWLDRDAA